MVVFYHVCCSRVIEKTLITAELFSNLEMVAPSCTAAVLEGLETGRVYTFRVYSENAAGMSEALQGPKAVRIQPGIGNHFPFFVFCLLFTTFGLFLSRPV